eukprot:scaffold2292_cov301-Pavlova_lutheri.AAC.10
MVADTSKIETRSGRFKPGNPKKSTSLVGMTQRGLASILKLEFQLEHLDYNAESWYHADLDIKDFDRLQKESGESLMSFSRSMSKSAFTTFWKKQKEVGGQPWERFLRHVQFFVPMPLIAQVLLSSLLSRVGSENPPKSSAFLDLMEFNISSALKRMLGKQLSLLGDASELASEGAASSVLIGARNAAAVEQVAEAAAAGCERVALLYGAAHSPDLERRLLEELGLYRVPLTDAGWVDAWNIAAPIADSEEQRSNTLRYVALLFISFVMATDLYLWESIVTRQTALEPAAFCPVPNIVLIRADAPPAQATGFFSCTGWVASWKCARTEPDDDLAAKQPRRVPMALFHPLGCCIGMRVEFEKCFRWIGERCSTPGGSAMPGPSLSKPHVQARA